MVNEINDILAITPGNVKGNVKVVTPKDVGRDYLLHVSIDGSIKAFEPRLTLRGASQENRTITRVCTSLNILGCLIGYGAVNSDIEFPSTGKEEDKFYKGGWYIYSIPFEAALRPNSKLVYDADHSEEHWLITYNEETKKYKSAIAGKCFYAEVSLLTRSGKDCVSAGSLYLQIDKEEGVYFTEEIHLPKGFYLIEGFLPSDTSLKKDDDYKVTIITEGEFKSRKKLSAALLSYDDGLPCYTKW